MAKTAHRATKRLSVVGGLSGHCQVHQGLNRAGIHAGRVAPVGQTGVLGVRGVRHPRHGELDQVEIVNRVGRIRVLGTACRTPLPEVGGAGAIHPATGEKIAMGALPKELSWRSLVYLKFVAGHPCAICGAEDGTVVAAHYGRHGMGSKASDIHTVPLCYHCHAGEHNGGGTMIYLEKLMVSMRLLNEWLVKSGR